MTNREHERYLATLTCGHTKIIADNPDKKPGEKGRIDNMLEVMGERAPVIIQVCDICKEGKNVASWEKLT